MYTIGLFLGSMVLSYSLIHPMAKLIKESNLLKPNYKGKLIPSYMGIAFIISSQIILSIALLARIINIQDAIVLIFLVMGFALIGLLDDFMGNRGEGGIKGHIKALILNKRLTTGVIKILSGGTLALVAGCILGTNGWELILNTCLIALSANIINLLDVRPGRAVKGFFLGMLIAYFAMFVSGSENLLLFIPIIGSVVSYAPWDIRAKVMMGDCGSNALGAVMGLGFVYGLSLYGKILVSVFFILLHIYTEKHSLSERIQNSVILRWVDRIGQEKGTEAQSDRGTKL